MAEEDVVIEERPSDKASDRRLASVLRQQKQQAKNNNRPSKSSRAVSVAGSAAKTSGRAMQAGGATVEYSGKAVKATGKGVQSVGKGITKGGESLTRLGAGLSGTGLGAIVGVPLAIVGVGLTGVGAGTQAVGKGVEAGGRVAEKGGQTSRRAGKQLSSVGSDLKKHAHTSGSLRAQKADKRREGRSLLGETIGYDHNVLHSLTAPVRLGTDMALRTAWINIIYSGGLSLIWVNIHVFFRFVLGTDFFCKLGREWVSGPGKTGEIAKGAGKLGSFVVTNATSAVGIVESMILVFVDVLVISFILIIVSLIAYAVGIFTNPLDFVVSMVNIF